MIFSQKMNSRTSFCLPICVILYDSTEELNKMCKSVGIEPKHSGGKKSRWLVSAQGLGNRKNLNMFHRSEIKRFYEVRFSIDVFDIPEAVQYFLNLPFFEIVGHPKQIKDAEAWFFSKTIEVQAGGKV